VSRRVPCPACPVGHVAIGLAVWPTPAGVRRSTWADEPLRCTAGCPLTTAQVVILLRRAARGAVQLPLLREEALC
jgi:hypothetical protein